ncbi:MAG: L,D-transpeptidase [Oscillospiraceae bacterium]|nr:L,D-transpeptidase [Oscillospiraceae bacterium]
MRKLAIILLSFLLICLFNYKNNVLASEPLDLADIDLLGKQVDSLYTDGEKSMLSDDITKDIIEKIKIAISKIKTNLEEFEDERIEEIIFDFKNAERLFSIRSIVNSLFDSTGFVLDNANLLEAQLAVSNFKEEYPDFYEKELNEIIKAENQKKEIEEKTKILNTLFTDETRKNAIDSVTREKYTEVLNSINAMPASSYKEKFLQDLSNIEKVILDKERLIAEEEARVRAIAEEEARAKAIAEEEARARAAAEEKARLEREQAIKALIEAEPIYSIKVSKSTHIMSIFSKDESGNYSVLSAEYLVATGRTPGLTPVGTFALGNKQIWHEWSLGGSASPYATAYAKGLYIHGPIYGSTNFDTVFASSIREIGFNKTSGCIRTTVEAAKFVFDNCVQGTSLQITN